jgi:serine/threonine protein kinase/tetratricopeptide (TPR) repeat protein
MNLGAVLWDGLTEIAMNAERGRQIERFYRSALQREPSQRDAFLAEACQGDEELRREIESRLAKQGTPDEPMSDSHSSATAGQAGALSPQPVDPLSPGSLVAGRFRVVREVGRGTGGMGLVYEAIDEKLDRRVALKRARQEYRDRLQPEVRAAREVSHFNVCKVHDLHVASTPQGEIEFVSMEFIEGLTLSEQIDQHGPLPPLEAREIARQICSGVAQAHSQGVIHGDLKTGNVILSQLPKGGIRAVITDFGLAHMKPVEAIDTTRSPGGTPDYMAPELLLGESPTVASDLYALGILFHVMLKGHSPRPVEKSTASTPPTAPAADPLANTLSVPASSYIPRQRAIEDLPSPWRKVVTKCVSTRPEDRYKSAEALMDALKPSRIWLKAGLVAVAAVACYVGYWWLSASFAPPTGPPVRLVVLPFSTHGDTVDGVSGIGLDIAERLSGSRRNFSVISPQEAERNHVDTPEKAKNMLGATHVLETDLRRSNGKITVNASVIDLTSGRAVGDPLNGTYNAGDTPTLAKAIIATVTGAFRLRARVPKESVSGPAYSYYVQGIELLRQDAFNADKAIPFLDKAIDLDPQSALPYAGLADAQIRKFQAGGGAEWLDRATLNVTKGKAINPDSVPVLLVSGALQEEHGSYERAIKDFTRATELEPGNPETWGRLAEVYFKANRTEEAIATYHKAIDAEPNYYSNYLKLGNLYWYRSQFNEAEQLYRRVTEIAPNLSTGHMNLGLALVEEGRFQEAEQSLLHALQLHRSSYLLMNVGALYYAQEQYAKAVPFFEESVASGPPSAIQYRDLGDVYRHLGRDREATKAYRTAANMAQQELTRNPRDAYSRILLALVSAFLGDSQRALAEASQALAMEPDNAIVAREAAIMYEALHQRIDTLRLLRNAPRHVLEELNRQPDVKDLQRDPSFQKLLQAEITRQ